ncbi:MAG: AfsR/SARP family transcriptional regulator, partial [Propylenella sp.]
MPEKAYALVAYLVLTSRGDPATRASLRPFLWEESDSKAAATNLRKFLSRVLERQRECGCEMILSRRDHVELAKSVEIDLTEFLKLVTHHSSADLVKLCDLYRGDLLEGYEWAGTDVQDWLSVQRAKLRDAFIGALVGRLEPLDPDADKMAIRIAARRLLEVDPYNEVGHRALMRLFAEEGEPARVRDVFQSLEARLQDELGVDPDEATADLYRSLLPATGSPLSPSRPSVVPTPSATLPSAAAPVDDGAASSEEPVAVSDRSGTPRVTVLPPLPIAGQDYGHQLAASLIEDITIGLCRSKALSIIA